MPSFREIFAGLILLVSGLLALVPYLLCLTQLYRDYKGKPDTRGHAYMLDVIAPLLVLGISYQVYAKYSWARTTSLVIVLIDLSFFAVLVVCAGLSLLFHKRRM